MHQNLQLVPLMDYPKPLVIEPLRLLHEQTFILLHGRGSSGNKIGSVLLKTDIALTASSIITNNNIEILSVMMSHLASKYQYKIIGIPKHRYPNHFGGLS